MESPLSYWRMDTTTPVLLRIDGNVPHEEQSITHDFRLRRMIPTLDVLYQRGCPIILATHIDRPQAVYDANVSTAMIATWLARNGYNSTHVPYAPNTDIADYIAHVKPQPRTITVLENTRFFSGEKEKTRHFIKHLSEPATYYINDAWGMMHRDDASVYAVAKEFSPEHRGYGHLVEQELAALTPLRTEPTSPFVVISGGAKVASKVPMLETLVDREHVDTIIVTPGIAGTFLYARGYDIGQSLYEPAYVPQAERILRKAQERDIHVDIPSDVYITRNTWENALEAVSVEDVPPNGIIIASGPETLTRYQSYLNAASNVCMNGPMGDIQYLHTIHPYKQLLHMIEASDAYRVVGGGDSVAMIHTLAIDPFDFYSTGGGATLAYISGAELEALRILTHTS